MLVGDPGQLASIEAGAVLGDIVGPAAERMVIGASARRSLEAACGVSVDAAEPAPGVTIGDGIVVLDRVHRFGGGIAALASAVRRGDADAVLGLLNDPPDDVVVDPDRRRLRLDRRTRAGQSRSGLRRRRGVRGGRRR